MVMCCPALLASTDADYVQSGRFAQKRVIYQPVTIEPREITPRVIREENYGGCEA